MQAPLMYSAYGITIASELSLPGLHSAPPGAPPDVVVRVGEVSPDDVARNDWDDTMAASVPGLAGIRIERGELIVIDPHESADPDLIGAFTAGEVLSTLLRQRGLLVLHASVIVRDKQAIGVLGWSGWGKSTTAAAFAERGWKLLSDDVLAADLSGPRPLVFPGSSEVRLAPDSGARLPDLYAESPLAHSQTAKRRVAWDDAFTNEPAELHALFVLSPEPDPDYGIEALTRTEATFEVVCHSRGISTLRSPRYTRLHLDQVAQVVRTIPVARLLRRPGIGELGELVRLVEREVDAGGPPLAGASSGIITMTDRG